MNRVFIFGIDGLTFRILNPFIERGLLPNFQRVRDEGVQGVLQSTTPSMTPPAWMSIATGVSPAKHGVYDFWDYIQTENGPQLSILTHRKSGKAIWSILSEWGKHVIVANVPMTYPPEPVNGSMLSGYMAPDMKAKVTFPESLKEELLQEVPNYHIDLEPAVSSGQKGDPLAATLHMTRERIAALYLLLKKPWDFFFIVFTGADRIQHLRWDEIMTFHPDAVAYYQMLDEALGTVLSSLNTAEDMLMIVSDHGFQGARRRFYIQEYLYRKNLLRIKGNSRRNAELIGLIKALVRITRARKVARFVQKQLFRSGVLASETEHHAMSIPHYDWAKTRAWIPSSSGAIAGYADIFLSNAMTEEEIILLIKDLQAIRDPKTGKLALAAVYRENVFGTGPFAPSERHLIVLAEENVTLQTELGLKSLWNTCDVSYGIHHPEGVMYMFGAKLKQDTTIAPVHIYDIVPTIMSYMGIPSAQELDGKIITEAFTQSITVDTDSQSESVVKQKLKKFAL